MKKGTAYIEITVADTGQYQFEFSPEAKA